MSYKITKWEKIRFDQDAGMWMYGIDYLFSDGTVGSCLYYVSPKDDNSFNAETNIKVHKKLTEREKEHHEFRQKWEEAKQRWNALTPEQQEEERKKTAAYDERILAESGYFDDEEDEQEDAE